MRSVFMDLLSPKKTLSRNWRATRPPVDSAHTINGRPCWISTLYVIAVTASSSVTRPSGHCPANVGIRFQVTFASMPLMAFRALGLAAWSSADLAVAKIGPVQLTEQDQTGSQHQKKNHYTHMPPMYWIPH
jgi:hypothetical protein